MNENTEQNIGITKKFFQILSTKHKSSILKKSS